MGEMNTIIYVRDYLDGYHSGKKERTEDSMDCRHTEGYIKGRADAEAGENVAFRGMIRQLEAERNSPWLFRYTT